MYGINCTFPCRQWRLACKFPGLRSRFCRLYFLKIRVSGASDAPCSACMCKICCDIILTLYARSLNVVETTFRPQQFCSCCLFAPVTCISNYRFCIVQLLCCLHCIRARVSRSHKFAYLARTYLGVPCFAPAHAAHSPCFSYPGIAVTGRTRRKSPSDRPVSPRERARKMSGATPELGQLRAQNSLLQTKLAEAKKMISEKDEEVEKLQVLCHSHKIEL